VKERKNYLIKRFLKNKFNTFLELKLTIFAVKQLLINEITQRSNNSMSR
jgi:hypothetical protein